MTQTGSILVVDNESDQLEMMRDILGRLGYAVKTADDPETALDLARRQRFDLIFIDLIMPEIDGTELCEQIRQVRPQGRILAFSGHTHLYSPERLERAGFDGHIAKPASIEEIKAALG